MMPARSPGLGGGLAGSLLLHVVIIAAFVSMRGSPQPMPPVIALRLVAAQAGPRQVGVVQPPTEQPATTETPRAAEVVPETRRPTPVERVRTPTRTPKQATATPSTAPTPPKAVAPTAGGGPVGGRGTDVANINTGGIAFEHPGYLNNIVNRVIERFSWSGPRVAAEVSFRIRRDGTVDPDDIRVVKSSGVYRFDTRAIEAVEAAAEARVFGPLPQGFKDDVLIVFFRFDPGIIR